MRASLGLILIQLPEIDQIRRAEDRCRWFLKWSNTLSVKRRFRNRERLQLWTIALHFCYPIGNLNMADRAGNACNQVNEWQIIEPVCPKQQVANGSADWLWLAINSKGHQSQLYFRCRSARQAFRVLRRL